MALYPDTPLTRYASAIAKATGLSFVGVLAWIRAEGNLKSAGAPYNNFLNIMVPGTHTVEHYATPEAGAAAVISNLRTPLYAPVLAVAHSTNDPKTELLAIAHSPWDAGHYTGGVAGAPWGSTLLGALAAIVKDPGGEGTSVGGPSNKSPVDTAVGDVTQPVTDALGGVTGWIQQEAALGLSYVVLTLLGLVFVVFGTLDAFGYSPARVAGAAVPKPAGDPIPF